MAKETEETKNKAVTAAAEDVKTYLEEKGYIVYALNGSIGSDKDGVLKQGPAQIFIDLKPVEEATKADKNA